MNRPICIIFGGMDPEAIAAIAVAKNFGLMVAYATLGGQKVNPGTAYKADGYVLDNPEAEMPEDTQFIIFECSRKAAGEGEILLHCDHHNPGDVGFGKGPEKFFEASSLGQLMNYLRVEPDERQLYIAAGDHCPADAYAGRCQGVDQASFLAFRIQEKLSSPFNKGKTFEDIAMQIEEAKAKLAEAPILFGNIRDMTSGEVPELPEAALSTGYAYLALLDDVDFKTKEKTGKKKLTLAGCTTPEQVKAFMAYASLFARFFSIDLPYGDPIRGYAGVVFAPTTAEVAENPVTE